VFSTLHTNKASSAVTRLLNMGVEPFLIAAALNMVLAQRLVRRICPKCRQEYEPPRNMRKAVERLGYDIKTYFKGIGCRRCRNSGFSGRIGVHELLVVNDEMRDAITAGATLTTIRDIARRNGMASIGDDGFRKVREGITTVSEVMRAAGDLQMSAVDSNG